MTQSATVVQRKKKGIDWDRVDPLIVAAVKYAISGGRQVPRNSLVLAAPRAVRHICDTLHKYFTKLTPELLLRRIAVLDVQRKATGRPTILATAEGAVEADDAPLTLPDYGATAEGAVEADDAPLPLPDYGYGMALQLRMVAALDRMVAYQAELLTEFKQVHTRLQNLEELQLEVAAAMSSTQVKPSGDGAEQSVVAAPPTKEVKLLEPVPSSKEVQLPPTKHHVTAIRYDDICHGPSWEKVSLRKRTAAETDWLTIYNQLGKARKARGDYGHGKLPFTVFGGKAILQVAQSIFHHLGPRTITWINTFDLGGRGMGLVDKITQDTDLCIIVTAGAAQDALNAAKERCSSLGIRYYKTDRPGSICTNHCADYLISRLFNKQWCALRNRDVELAAGKLRIPSSPDGRLRGGLARV